jgi:hypothetical protein
MAIIQIQTSDHDIYLIINVNIFFKYIHFLWTFSFSKIYISKANQDWPEYFIAIDEAQMVLFI